MPLLRLLFVIEFLFRLNGTGRRWVVAVVVGGLILRMIWMMRMRLGVKGGGRGAGGRGGLGIRNVIHDGLECFVGFSVIGGTLAVAPCYVHLAFVALLFRPLRSSIFLRSILVFIARNRFVFGCWVISLLLFTDDSAFARSRRWYLVGLTQSIQLCYWEFFLFEKLIRC